MPDTDIALMAHLIRRAGFGATRDELEARAAQGYEATVEELVFPDEHLPPWEDEDIFLRYHGDVANTIHPDSMAMYWVYRMVNTNRPLEEKMALFWHGIFATAFSKVNQPNVLQRQIDMFRAHGLANFRDLLIELSKDPAMIYWLDNINNHRGAINENYGRELLELFSMGIGNYGEEDVKEASRAFTGWTIRNATLHDTRVVMDSFWPYGRLGWQFEYRDNDHDDGEKSFLGHSGNFGGEDIIEIICKEPATASFFARHLYNFFVADEPQVPSWGTVPPRDPEAIKTLTDAFFEHDYDIGSVLRLLFNSDFFKDALFAKVRSPAELVAGTVRLAGGHRFPSAGDIALGMKSADMGQSLLNPPSVEGWHTGAEWVTSGSLVDRVNFAVAQLADLECPGVRGIIEKIRAYGERLSPEDLVDACLDLMGPLTLEQRTRRELVAQAQARGELRFGSEGDERISAERVQEMMQLIVSTREYQLV